MSKMFLLGIFLFNSFVLQASSQLELNKIPPFVQIGGDDGGLTEGGTWSSDGIKGKIYMLFYVDPDEKDLNVEFEETLNNLKLSPDIYTTIAVVNMAATWMPNAAISIALSEKQKKYPDAIYVKDKNKVLVKKWGIQDDAYNTLLFDKSGNLIYFKAGKMEPSDTKTFISLLKSTGVK